jgi:hypothetical protein
MSGIKGHPRRFLALELGYALPPALAPERYNTLPIQIETLRRAAGGQVADQAVMNVYDRPKYIADQRFYRGK